MLHHLVLLTVIASRVSTSLERAHTEGTILLRIPGGFRPVGVPFDGNVDPKKFTPGTRVDLVLEFEKPPPWLSHLVEARRKADALVVSTDKTKSAIIFPKLWVLRPDTCGEGSTIYVLLTPRSFETLSLLLEGKPRITVRPLGSLQRTQER